MDNKFTLGFDDGTSKSYTIDLHWQTNEKAYYRGPEFYVQLRDYIKEAVSRSGHELNQIKSLTANGEELSVSWDENQGVPFNELFMDRISECFIGHGESGYGSNDHVDLTGALSFSDVIEN